MSESPQMFVPFQPKTETRRGGKFEDVQRPNQQTFMHGLLRFGQIVLVLLATYSWAKVAQAYETETVTGRLSELLGAAIWFITLLLTGYVVARIFMKFDADLTWVIVIVASLLVVWLAFNFIASPVIVFALLMIERNMLYILPILITAAAAAFVPSLEIGRFSFWRELTDQSGTNSEKPVIDETAIKLKQMDIDLAREQWAVKESALKTEIERLQAMVRTPQSSGIDPEPDFKGGKTIDQCIRPIKVNGHWEFDAETRHGWRRLDSTLLLQFVIEAWAYNKFERKYWLDRGLKRDDWEAMRGAVDWCFFNNRLVRGIDDAIAELMRFGVITPAQYGTPPSENVESLSRPIVEEAGTKAKPPKTGAGGS